MIAHLPLTEDLHHEIELVLAVGKSGANIAAKDAMMHIWGAGVGIDFTRRDLQIAHREKGRPWDWGKAFDHSAPLSPLIPLADIPKAQAEFNTGRIWLSVNGELRIVLDLLQSKIQEAILLTARMDADEPVPGKYRGLVDEYYQVLSDDLR